MTLEYDLNGNILKQKERAPGSDMGEFDIDRNFAYDPLNRLLQATGRESATNNGTEHYGEIIQNSYNSGAVQAYTRNYTYDKVGNIQTLIQTGSNGFTRNFNYVAGTNRLYDIRNGSDSQLENYTYDANGNQLTAGATRKYFWDYADRLVAYSNQTGTAEPTIYAHYLYDAAGQRVKKLIRTQGGDIETRVYIDGIFEYGRSNTDEQNVVHIMDDQSRIARVRIGHNFGDTSDAILYNIEDHLGSSALRLSTTGTVVDREEYYPFGDSSLRTFDKKRYRYTGKEKDAESGLYYYGARYYAAWTCRFLSVDPLALKYVFQTPYAYADNNPIMKNDPTGMGTGEGGGGGNNGGGGEKTDNVNTGDTTFDEQANAALQNYGTQEGYTVKIEIHNVDGKFSEGTITVSNAEKSASVYYSPDTGFLNSEGNSVAEAGVTGGNYAGDFAKGTKFGTEQQYQIEPARGDTETGIRNSEGGRVKNGKHVGEPVIRVDADDARPHAKVKGPHINIEPKYSPGGKDPHIKIPKILLKGLSWTGKFLAKLGKIAKPIGAFFDGIRLIDAFERDNRKIGANSSEAIGGVVGSWAGAIGGAWAGGKLGIIIGGAVGGPVGAAIGGLLGALIGGIGGAIAGDKLGSAAGRRIYENRSTMGDGMKYEF